MELKQVATNFYVSPQIQLSELDLIEKQGIHTIINNRPDNEEITQPQSAVWAELMAKKSIDYHYLPVVGGQITLEQVQSFAQLLSEVKTPILAFCRSGTRSITLWALSQAFMQKLSVDEILQYADNAGYNLAHLAPTLQQLWEMPR